MTKQVSIITVDGPSGAGKGTLSAQLAKRLSWHFLDSGAIYRVLAIAALHHDISLDDVAGLSPLASGLDVTFTNTDMGTKIILEGEDVSQDIRNEEVGAAASTVASIPLVREALLRRQRSFAQAPGLVADGRDMGTVVFPNADVKLFLTASAEVRAERRFKELKARGLDVKISRLLSDIKARDERDMTRSSAPLKPAEDAVLIDSSELNALQVFEKAYEILKLKEIV